MGLGKAGICCGQGCYARWPCWWNRGLCMCPRTIHASGACSCRCGKAVLPALAHLSLCASMRGPCPQACSFSSAWGARSRTLSQPGTAASTPRLRSCPSCAHRPREQDLNAADKALWPGAWMHGCFALLPAALDSDPCPPGRTKNVSCSAHKACMLPRKPDSLASAQMCRDAQDANRGPALHECQWVSTQSVHAVPKAHCHGTGVHRRSAGLHSGPARLVRTGRISQPAHKA